MTDHTCGQCCQGLSYVDSILRYEADGADLPSRVVAGPAPVALACGEGPPRLRHRDPVGVGEVTPVATCPDCGGPHPAPCPYVPEAVAWACLGTPIEPRQLRQIDDQRKDRT